MQVRLFTLLVATALLLAYATPALAGGWALVTLDELPSDVRAGQPVQLGMMVRQHGRRPNSDVELTVLATKSGSNERVEARGRQQGAVGHFVVDITFPSDGTWAWEAIPAPFGGTTFAPLSVLPAVPAQAAPAQPTTTVATIINPVQVAGGLLLLAALVVALLSRRRVALRPATTEAR